MDKTELSIIDLRLLRNVIKDLDGLKYRNLGNTYHKIIQMIKERRV